MKSHCPTALLPDRVKVNLASEYHCLAEDLGHTDRGAVVARGEDLCKLVEYASCDLTGSGEDKSRMRKWERESQGKTEE